MKKQFMMIAVALMTAGVLTTSCSNDDAAIEKPTEQTAKGNMLFTATIAPKDGTTRSVNADGVTTWVENEQIAVYYQKTDDSYATATANVDAVNGGKATISAMLSNAKNGSEVKFVYPASIANATGDDIDATKLAAQHGTIADISANFDAATATATLATNGTTCGTTADISFTNQVVIGKFTPTYGGNNIDEITTLTVTDGTNTYTVTPTSGKFGTTGIYVAMLPVADQEVIITAQTASQNYGFGGKKITLAKGKLYNNLAIAMGKLVNLTGRSSDYTAQDGDFITGSMTNYNLTIAANANVTISNMTLTKSGSKSGRFICGGNNTITLSGINSVSQSDGYTGYPAIYSGPTGTTLTIKGCGRLTASCYSSAAVIGAGRETESCGNIIIRDGEIIINLDRNDYYVGIGCYASSDAKSCGDITIEGGHIVVSMTGTYSKGTAIGCYGFTNEVTCGNITISGGIVEASSNSDGTAIGSLANNSNNVTCGDITITGGTVTANGGDYSPGIGGGKDGSSCGNITISGGTVTATGQDGGAGIGTGNNGSCGNILINGTANVTATSVNNGGAGIGCGKNSAANVTCGSITIGGSASVTAMGKTGGAGIGSGHKSGTGSNTCGAITISGGTVVASVNGGNTDEVPSAGIGTGYGSTCGSISITGGTVTATHSPLASLSSCYDIGLGVGGSISDSGTPGTVTVDASVQTSTGKHYTSVATNGYNKEQ